MSEITRKALEGMGFAEIEGGGYRFMNKQTFPNFVYFSDDLKDVFYGSPFDEVPVINNIRTLPQLRQLIRSLFGEDALPRRELSSITDEECRQLVNIIFPTVGDRIKTSRWGNRLSSISSELLGKRELECGIVIDGDELHIVSMGVTCRFDSHRGWYYLVNDCDFHLPAFHGAHNE